MVVVIDYGMGNTYSVLSALRYLGIDPKISRDRNDILNAEHLILPGVGSYGAGMAALKSRRLDACIIDAVVNRGTKILGVCLGMQLLGSCGTEGGCVAGLGLIPNKTEKFRGEEVGVGKKVPHMGFNLVKSCANTGLFKDLSKDAYFYFMHSYRMLPGGLNGGLGICTYGIDFLAAFEVDNICGTQFHPEKSQTNGLILLRNFIEK